jgi:transcriptional adapter 2-alpha
MLATIKTSLVNLSECKVTDQTFDIDAREFHSHKRARIAAMRQSALDLANAVSKPHTILTSAPTNHEIQGYMPGRLDFETEVENEAEDAVKDMDFGLVMEYGGADQPEPGPPPTPALDHEPGSSESRKDGDGGDAESNDTTLVGTLPDPIETADSTMLKLSMLGIYYEKLDRRQEAKSFVFDRGMLDYKKVRNNCFFGP